MEKGSADIHHRYRDRKVRLRDLTEKQSEIFEYIHGKLVFNGLAPTVQEIQREFGGSPYAAQTLLNALEKKGFIR